MEGTPFGIATNVTFYDIVDGMPQGLSPQEYMEVLVARLSSTPHYGPDGRFYDPNQRGVAGLTPGYHIYWLLTALCSVYENGCSVPNAFDSHSYRPAPGKLSDRPAVDYSTTEIYAPRLVYMGTVYHEVDEANHSIVNITKDNHMLDPLDPGYVFRQILKDDQYVYMMTIGEGMGMFPGPNSMFAAPLWHAQDQRVIYDLRHTFIDPPYNPSLPPWQVQNPYDW